ncbi:MAG: pyrimidine dimer DNA glycosylase/endonuclease V [Bacteroidales bacterium]|nr:pyrimidine dimer DNA glycosylase/endonuclease V [Bacteroidales bacterium]
MRIWSIHPKYLDTKGLVALWRETLLAKHVLEGKTKGYTNHPQLYRFKTSMHPLSSVNQYLSEVFYEACKRGFHFDKTKISWDFTPDKIAVTKGQLNFETTHLLRKLKIRDNNRYNGLAGITSPEPHPLFTVVEGEIEEWEKITS